MFWITKQWYGINIIEFYKDCSLEKSEKFVFDGNMFAFFAGINLLLTVMYLLYERWKKNKSLNVDIKELCNFRNCCNVLLLHWVFEVQMQEYYALLLPNQQ